MSGQGFHTDHDGEPPSIKPILVLLALSVAVIFAVLIFSAQCREQIIGEGENDARSQIYTAGASNRGGYDPGYHDRFAHKDAIDFLKSSPALAWRSPQTVYATLSDSQIRALEIDSGEVPWEGLNILQDFTALTLDPEFGATFRSVMECESGGDPLAVGALGERGVLQLHPIHRQLVERMGYAWGDMFQLGPNILVAEAIWKESEWQPWSCKPQWRADGTSGEW